jgi:hypothetical protein
MNCLILRRDKLISISIIVVTVVVTVTTSVSSTTLAATTATALVSVAISLKVPAIVAILSILLDLVDQFVWHSQVFDLIDLLKSIIPRSTNNDLQYFLEHKFRVFS